MKRGIIKYGAAILLLIIATIIIATRIDVWFGNPIEMPYISSSAPSRILLTMGNDAHSRMVTWQCDTTIEGAYIEYFRIDDLTETDACQSLADGEKYTSEGGTSIFYRASMNNLSTGQYAYRVCHPSSTSQWHTFQINDTSDNSLKMVFIGDIQDTINGATHSIIDDIALRHPEVDFYMLGGDFIHRPQDCYWEEGFRGISPIATNHTVLAVSGNHEHRKGIVSTCERRFPMHFAYFLSRYDMSDYCFHSFCQENVEFFLLDSHCDITRLIKQRNDLEKAFKESSAQWKIVVLHHPPHSVRNRWNNIHLRWLFSPLFSRYHVDLVLSGHEHGYARIDTSNAHQLPIYTISHCSPKRYSHDNSSIAVRYDNDNRYYQVIDINRDTLVMNVYTTDGLLLDSVKIIQSEEKHIIQ